MHIWQSDRNGRYDLLVPLWVMMGMLALVVCASAADLGLSGRVTSVSYLYDPMATVQVPDPDSALDQLCRLSFSVKDAQNQAWSLYYNGTLSGEILNDGVDGMANRIYRGYLQYKPTGALQVQMGRIWANGGVGSGLYDGAQLRWRSSPGTLVVVAGTRGFNAGGNWTLHEWNSSGWNQSGKTGVFFRSRELADKLSLGGSWSRAVASGAEESEKVGGMFQFRASPAWTLFYENQYELNQEVFLKQYLQGRYRFSTGSVAVGWTRREGYEPSYASTYIFRRFRYEPWFEDAAGRKVQELRTHLLLQPPTWKGWRLAVDLIQIFPDNQDRGDGLDVWVGNDRLKGGYRGMRGYRGEQDGFYGKVSYPVRPDILLWLDLNRVSYGFRDDALTEDDPDRHRTYVSRLGADFQLGRDWSISGSAERIQYPGVKYDIRGLLRISYRFDVGAQSREVWR